MFPYHWSARATSTTSLRYDGLMSPGGQSINQSTSNNQTRNQHPTIFDEPTLAYSSSFPSNDQSMNQSFMSDEYPGTYGPHSISQSINQSIDQSIFPQSPIPGFKPHPMYYQQPVNHFNQSINQSVHMSSPALSTAPTSHSLKLEPTQSISNIKTKSTKQIIDLSNDPPNSQSTSPTAAESIDQSTNPSKKRKKPTTRKIACQICHHAKTSCDGQRPCSRCIRLDRSADCYDRISKVGLKHQVWPFYDPSISQSISQSVNQSMNQPGLYDPNVSQTIHQSINQSINQSMSFTPTVVQTASGPITYVPYFPPGQSAYPSTHPSINQSIHPPVSQSIHQSVNQSISHSINQSTAHPMHAPINQPINQSAKQNDSSERSLHQMSHHADQHDRSSCSSNNHNNGSQHSSSDNSILSSINQSINQTINHSVHQSISQSVNQSINQSINHQQADEHDEDDDEHSDESHDHFESECDSEASTEEPDDQLSFHLDLSRTLRSAHIEWSRRARMNHAIKPTTHPLDLKQKLMFYTWLASMMTAQDVEAVMHEVALEELNGRKKQLKQSIDQTDTQANKQSNKQSNHPSNYQPCDGSVCDGFCPSARAWAAANPCKFTWTGSPELPLDVLEQSNKQTVNHPIDHALQYPNFGYPLLIQSVLNGDEIHAEESNHKLLINTIKQRMYEEKRSNKQTIKQQSDQSIKQSSDQSIKQSSDQSTSQSSDQPAVPVVMLDELIKEESNRAKVWECLEHVDSMTQLNESIDQLYARVENEVLSETSHLPLHPAPVCEIAMSVCVNSSFERLFGYSQSEFRALCVLHGSKALFRLTSRDNWHELMLHDQDASFGQQQEYRAYVTCITKWQSQIECLCHTKYTFDDRGKFKACYTHFIPLPNKKKTSNKTNKSNKQDKTNKTKKSQR